MNAGNACYIKQTSGKLKKAGAISKIVEAKAKKNWRTKKMSGWAQHLNEVI